MDMILIVAAIAVAVIAFYLLLSKLLSRRSARAGTAKAAAGEDRSAAQWRAVKVAPGLICCAAVGKLEGQVFLSRLSPRLPLDACDVKDCRCKYVHLEDRRSGGDRRAALGELDAYLPFNQAERRRSAGRRGVDLVD